VCRELLPGISFDIMKAVIITAPGPAHVLKLEEIPEPQVQAEDDVKVAVAASALNRADLLQRLGKYPPPRGVNPKIPGLEFAGIVEETGTLVRDWKPGDRVMGLLGGGGYAEKLVTKERLLLPVPSNLGLEEAAAIPEAFATAFDALFLQLALAPGESLLIHAVASGVGLASLQLAKTGGCTVYGTAGSDAKLQRAAELGLDAGINYRTHDFAAEVSRQTGRLGVDVIMDLVGGSYWERNLNSLKVRGRLILVGLLGGAMAQTNLAEILGKRLTIVGTVLRTRPVEEKMALTQELRRRMIPLLESKKIFPVIDRVFPLAQAAAAHAYMETNANVGKIVLTVDGRPQSCD
jgi:NADPH:quinone reductase